MTATNRKNQDPVAKLACMVDASVQTTPAQSQLVRQGRSLTPKESAEIEKSLRDHESSLSIIKSVGAKIKDLAAQYKQQHLILQPQEDISLTQFGQVLETDNTQLGTKLLKIHQNIKGKVENPENNNENGESEVAKNLGTFKKFGQ